MGQLSFSDIELVQSRKPSRVMVMLDKITEIVNWDKVLEIIKPVRKQRAPPHRELSIKVKMLFLRIYPTK